MKTEINNLNERDKKVILVLYLEERLLIKHSILIKILKTLYPEFRNLYDAEEMKHLEKEFFQLKDEINKLI